MPKIPTGAPPVKPTKVGHAFSLSVPVAFDSPTAIRDLCAMTSNPDAAIYALRLWDHRQRQAATFRVNDPIGVVERICGWRRKRGDLFAALVDTGLLAFGDDGSVTIPEWRAVATVEWMGAAGVKVQSSDPNAAERARRWRERRANGSRTETERDANGSERSANGGDPRVIAGAYARDTRATGPETGPVARPSVEVQKTSSSADDAPAQVSLIDAPPVRPDPTEAKIDQVLAHWQRTHGPNIDVAGETQAGKERRRRVRKHLNAKIPVEQMLAAIDGALRDDFIMGRDPKAPRAYRGVETILRDGTQIEKLAALRGGPNAPAAPQAASNRVPVAPPVVPMDWTASGELSRALNRPAFLGGPDDFRLPANREIPPDFQIPDGMKVVRVDPVPDRKVA